TVKTYTNAPPIPARVVGPSGEVLFEQADIERGQEVFFKYGLMEHGTLWGHGAYLGPDYTAEYLHRLAETTRDTLARSGTARGSAAPDETAGLLKENRYDPRTGVLHFSAGEAASFAAQKDEWRDYFAGATPAPGLPANYIRNPAELSALTAYFAWAAWAA